MMAPSWGTSTATARHRKRRSFPVDVSFTPSVVGAWVSPLSVLTPISRRWKLRQLAFWGTCVRSGPGPEAKLQADWITSELGLHQPRLRIVIRRGSILCPVALMLAFILVLRHGK